MLQKYVVRIWDITKRGDAREESYYSTLETLLVEYAEAKKAEDIHVTSQPKKTEAGNPDFRIWRGTQRIVGYIEAKTPDQDLNAIEKTPQIERYKNTFPNFVLTNFSEFRFFRNGFNVDTVTISDRNSIYDQKRKPLAENEDKLNNLLEQFFSFSYPSITSGKRLAIELAKRTRFLRDEVIAEELREERKNGIKKVLGFYEAFQKYLIRGLTKDDFADLYSQTITYGLFASRMRCEGEFHRRHAVDDIPRSIGILREMFEFISLGDLPIQLEWIVDDISNVLANVDVKGLFSEFYENMKGEDPIYHFYETFLAEYDPEEREKRGVYYTPIPIVSYIVRSLNTISKDKFGLKDGLANSSVTVLDPAAGTLTFIVEAMKLAIDEFVSKYGKGGMKNFLTEHILRDFYAFELMIAPYVIGHVKVSFLFDELGHKLQDERMKFFITDTLELEDLEQTSLPGMVSLAEESRKAGEVKKNIPILVILGNPPYSGISTNKGKWITDLIEDYKYVDGKHFGEKKHWLHDDYVKFIRFAEWKMAENKKGLVGFITNHRYLDNPTFRGMRQHLMKSFEEIYVLDLHGNAHIGEKSPDGSKDENVFDIMQGVAISFFVKRNESTNAKKCAIFYSEMWGLREEKYKQLSTQSINSTKWKRVNAHSPFYFFTPKRERHTELYHKFWKVNDVFPTFVNSIVTARDAFVIGFTEDEIRARLEKFRDLSVPDSVIREIYKLKDTRGWRLTEARKHLSQDLNWDKGYRRILYRPFDFRVIYYSGKMVDWTRSEMMENMEKENVALLVNKREELPIPYSHFLVTDTLSEHCCVSIKTTNYHFPLYLYEGKRRKENVNSKLMRKIQKAYSSNVIGRDLFYYAYGIFYSNTYRAKFWEFLRTDFPRLPVTSNYDLFKKISKIGDELVELHLMKNDTLEVVGSKFQGDGDNIVQEPIYDEHMARIYINKKQYFDEVGKEIWAFMVGSYQVLSKWLKYRKGRKLSLDEIKHYLKIITIIKRTIELQRTIEELYSGVEKELLEFSEDNKKEQGLEKFDN